MARKNCKPYMNLQQMYSYSIPYVKTVINLSKIEVNQRVHSSPEIKLSILDLGSWSMSALMNCQHVFAIIELIENFPQSCK